VGTDARLLGRDVVVVGASAGGVEALTRLAERLPPDLGAAVIVVLHVPAAGHSVLPDILARAGALPAAHAVDGEALAGGRIYVAPPDHHILVSDGKIELGRGPKENGHRPAIDPLFRSAATSLGRRLVGVVLSGSLDDGTLGLAAVKAAGGVTIAQDPAEALYPSMPTSAIERARPDLVLTVAGIAELLANLEPTPPGGRRFENGRHVMSNGTDKHPEEITRENEAAGATSRYTCPECSGTLWEVQEGNLVKLRCRVGHTYTEEAFFTEHAASLEAALWAAVVALEERADFARRLAERFGQGGMAQSAVRYREQAANALEQVALVRRALDDLAPPPAPEERAAS
jgi:two-component system, chemotaxis family, protein-glutamate methylesterase/glutaminase